MSREYNNTYSDYTEEGNDLFQISNDEVVYKVSFYNRLNATICKLQSKLSLDILEHAEDGYVYVGLGGVTMLGILYGKGVVMPECPLLHNAKQYTIQHATKCKMTKTVSFLNGDSGPIALSAIMHYYSNEKTCANHYIQKLLEIAPTIAAEKVKIPEELLYGRGGYLFALLYVRNLVSNDVVPDKVVRMIVEAILLSGKEGAKGKKGHAAPLHYEWHGKEYFGAAHGYAGILFTLLKAKFAITSDEMELLIEPTLEYLISSRFPSKNFPSSGNSSDDRLVQWCHGAPGFVYLFAEAYEVFNKESYLKLALECGEVVWNRGLLKKGYSLCHGVAGNAYAFLKLYQTTGDAKHLYRAVKFAEWCLDYNQAENLQPDRPFSLYEGMIGVLYFLTDMKKPKEAKFPGFDL